MQTNKTATQTPPSACADNYYLLPFCKPNPKEVTRHKWGGLGEVLQGNELIDSGLELKFRTDLPKKDICTLTLDDDKVGGGAGSEGLAGRCCRGQRGAGREV